MATPPGTTAHQEEPRALGGKLPHLIGQALAHDRAFLDALEQQRPHTFEGNVTAVQRDNTGTNRVQVQRTGQPRSDATWYTVWGTFYVPDTGDQVRLLVIGKGAAVLLGAKHGGRPHQWTIPYTGGSLHQRDAALALIHKHGDDHHHRHYRTDGATIAHHHHESGHVRHRGDAYHSVIGGIADNGTPTGPYVRHTMNAGSTNRYERRHHQNTGGVGEVLAHHHDVFSAMEHFFDDGTGTGTRASHKHDFSAHTHPKGHVVGDDGTGATVGKLHLTHASGHRVLDHDGTLFTHYANGGQTALTHDGSTLSWYSGGAVRGKHVNPGNWGQLHLIQASTPDFHVFGDDGAGKVHVQHAGGNRALDHDGTDHRAWAYSGATAGQHVHSYSAHTHPKGHVIGDDGSGVTLGALYLQHGGGNRAWDHNGNEHNHWGAGYLLAQTIIGTALRSDGTTSGLHRYRQHGTSSYHVVGDDGAGKFYTVHGSAGARMHDHDGTTSVHYVAGGAYSHALAQHTHTHPSGAYHHAPTTDPSVIDTFTAAGAGAIKRASHSTTPQVVGTGSATITTNNNIAHYSWPSGAPGDPHLKLIMACVWDSGAISNPGLYTHSPACVKGTSLAYGAEIYNTSGGGTNSSYVWGTQALAHDSQAWIYATQLGGAGNKVVGTALWAHVID